MIAFTLTDFFFKPKHKNICAKTSKKLANRKIFDSGKQRAEGSDVVYAKTKETKKVQILGQKPEV